MAGTINNGIPPEAFMYAGLVLISYAAYEVLRSRIPNQWKHYILSRSFILLIATLLGGFFVKDENLKQAIFTFSAVYLGFWLNEQVKFQEERRKLKFFLGAIWQELRYNRTLLETIKNNFEFYMDDVKNLNVMHKKFSSLNKHAGFLKSTVYDAFVSSTVITALKKDKPFNDLALAYTNMKFFQSGMGIVLTDFDIKMFIHTVELEKLNVPRQNREKYAEQMLADLGNKIQNEAGKELAIAYRGVCTAIDTVNEYLNTMMVKSEEDQKPEDTLAEEDLTFIDGILKPSPSVDPNNMFFREN